MPWSRLMPRKCLPASLKRRGGKTLLPGSRCAEADGRARDDGAQRRGGASEEANYGTQTRGRGSKSRVTPKWIALNGNVD